MSGPGGLSRAGEDRGGGDVEARTAEYVLGLLGPAEAEAFRRLAEGDPDIAARVAVWRETLAALADSLPAAVPPPGLWRRIEARLFGRPAPLWRRLGIGQAVIGGALAAAMVYGALQYGVLDLAPEAPPLTATLAAPAGDRGGAGPIARVDLDPAAGRLVARVAGPSPVPGRSLQLWLIVGDAPPVPLGSVSPGAPARLPLPGPPAGAAGLEGALLAITDEPAGAPAAGPGGAVLAIGPITRP